jgi:hypothetical protein
MQCATELTCRVARGVELDKKLDGVEHCSAGYAVAGTMHQAWELD